MFVKKMTSDLDTHLTKRPHILVVDDHIEISEPLCRHLQKNGFMTSSAPDAKTARTLLQTIPCDLIVLDIMMPGEDGLSLCKAISETTATPIILLTAMTEDIDRITGLEIGADDYVTKPFNPRELVARIRSVLRRAHPTKLTPSSTIAKFGDWQLNLERGELTKKDNDVIETLSSGELSLLKVFLAHPGQVLSRDELLKLTKGREAFAFERSVDIMISRLRQKIETSSADPQYIVTEWGGGYKFSAKVATP